MSVNHQHLRAFHAVASEASFSRAARRLNVSQPTLSQQIKALEHRYGRMLFEGRRRPLALTPLGVELLELTRQMFAKADEIEDLLGEQAGGEIAAIHLAADSPAYAARLAQILMAEDPALDLEVMIENSHNTLARLLDARADVAIVCDPQIDPRFIYRPMFTDRLNAVVPADHPLAARDGITPEDLAHECLILREATSKTRGAAEALLHAHEIVPRRRIEIHSREAIREAVAAGVGVSLFYSSECPPDVRLVTLPIDGQPDPALLTGYIVCRVERRRSPVVRRVLAAAAQITAILPYGTRPGAGLHSGATSAVQKAPATP